MRKVYEGAPVSEGLGIGEIYCYRKADLKPTPCRIAREEVNAKLAEYEGLKEKVDAELDDLINQLQCSQPDKSLIFMAHREILHDKAIDEKIRKEIGENLSDPAWAIYTVYEEFRLLLAGMKKQQFRERAQDVVDVRDRLLRAAQGIESPSLSVLPKPVIIACHDLLPSDTATLDRDNVIAIVTESGGETSHSAIIARGYGIPALAGIPGLMDIVKDKDRAIVDAIEGRLIIEPTEEEIERYQEEKERYLRLATEIRSFLAKDPITKDGARMEIGLNIGSVEEIRVKEAAYASFVGLFRTEFLYMSSPQLPTEDEQYESYKEVLEAFKRPVTLRTLDIGGDKTIPCIPLPKEENPFLGVRGIRLCFEKPEIFKTQLRAAFRASAHGELSLMLPMVASMEDIYQAKELINSVQQELAAEGIPMAPEVKTGIMVEVPSIALLADLAAKEVDFASIGTNDLCQYTLAVDRMNPRVMKCYQSFHLGLFRLIGYVVEEFRAAGKPVSVCGELAGNPLAVAVLIGLGVRRFSMNPSSIAKVKRIITQLTTGQAQELAEEVQRLATAAQVKRFLENELQDYLY